MLFWHIRKKIDLLYNLIIFAAGIYAHGSSATWDWLHIELGLFTTSGWNSATEHYCWESLCVHSSAFTCTDVPTLSVLMFPILIPFVDFMDLEEDVHVLVLLHKRIHKKKRRQYLVHSLLCTKLQTAQFDSLFYELRKRRMWIL
jgi:hypothetical protein